MYMDASQFVELAGRDPEVAKFIKEVAANATGHVEAETPRSYTLTGADFLIGIAAYALYRWLKDHFDHRRSMNETEVVREQTQIIGELIKEGVEPEAAQAVTVALLDQIAKRGVDDPMLNKAAGIVKYLTP
jgi:hypothetical protein